MEIVDLLYKLFFLNIIDIKWKITNNKGVVEKSITEIGMTVDKNKQLESLIL